jgi:hypothetical protein
MQKTNGEKSKTKKVIDKNLANKHSWFISKYSRKYNTEILVFNPFRRLRKDDLQNNNIALT